MRTQQQYEREPLMSREQMRVLTKDTLVPVGAVLAAVAICVSVLGYFNRRDANDASSMAAIATRVALLEADAKALHASQDGLSSKMDKLIDSVNDLRIRLGAPAAKP